MLKTIIVGVTLGLLAMTGSALAQQSPAPAAPASNIKRTPLQKFDVPGANYETVIGMAEIVPNVNIGSHTHPGVESGYMLEGEMIFELEGEPERVIPVGEAFWEPGGDVIHYQAANNLSDAWSRFVVTMIGVPGEPMLTLVSDDELAERRDRRAPRPASS